MVIELRQRSPLDVVYRTPLDVFGQGAPSPGPSPPPARCTITFAHVGGTDISLPPTRSPCQSNANYDPNTPGPDSALTAFFEEETSPGVWEPMGLSFQNLVSGTRWQGDTSGATFIMGGPAPRWCSDTLRLQYNPTYEGRAGEQFVSGLNKGNFFYSLPGRFHGLLQGETCSFVDRPTPLVGASINQVQSGGTVNLAAPNPTNCTPGATYDSGTAGNDMNVEFALTLYDGAVWRPPQTATEYINNFRGVSFIGSQSGATMTMGGDPADLFCNVNVGGFDRVIYDPPFYGVRHTFLAAGLPSPEDEYWIQNFTTAWILAETVIAQ